MRLAAVFAAGMICGIIFTFFTSLLTELIVLAAVIGAIVYIARREWAKPPTPPDTLSTTKKSPFESS